MKLYIISDNKSDEKLVNKLVEVYKRYKCLDVIVRKTDKNLSKIDNYMDIGEIINQEKSSNFNFGELIRKSFSYSLSNPLAIGHNLKIYLKTERILIPINKVEVKNKTIELSSKGSYGKTLAELYKEILKTETDKKIIYINEKNQMMNINDSICYGLTIKYKEANIKINNIKINKHGIIIIEGGDDL